MTYYRERGGKKEGRIGKQEEVGKGRERVLFSKIMKQRPGTEILIWGAFFQLNHLILYYVTLFPHLLFLFQAEIMEDYATTQSY